MILPGPGSCLFGQVLLLSPHNTFPSHGALFCIHSPPCLSPRQTLGPLRLSEPADREHLKRVGGRKEGRRKEEKKEERTVFMIQGQSDELQRVLMATTSPHKPLCKFIRRAFFLPPGDGLANWSGLQTSFVSLVLVQDTLHSV